MDNTWYTNSDMFAMLSPIDNDGSPYAKEGPVAVEDIFECNKLLLKCGPDHEVKTYIKVDRFGKYEYDQLCDVAIFAVEDEEYTKENENSYDDVYDEWFPYAVAFGRKTDHEKAIDGINAWFKLYIVEGSRDNQEEFVYWMSRHYGRSIDDIEEAWEIVEDEDKTDFLHYFYRHDFNEFDFFSHAYEDRLIMMRFFTGVYDFNHNDDLEPAY